MRMQMGSHCPRGSYNLAPRRLIGISALVLLLSCAVVHIRDSDIRASLFLRPSIQLRGHELPEARAFTLYLFSEVVPMRNCQSID